MRRRGDTANPPTSTGTTQPPPRATRSATKPPPLPRAAAAVALGNVPIEAASVDATAPSGMGSSGAGIPTSNADDEDSSAITAYLAMPVGMERRAHKATTPPPPRQEFPIEEERASVLPSGAPSRHPPPSADAGPIALLRGKSIGLPNLAIAGGAIVLLIVVLVFALRGDDGKKSTAKAVEPSPPAEKNLPVVDPRSGSDQAAVVPDAASGSAEGSAAVGSAADGEIEIALPGSAAGSGTDGNGTHGSGAATPTTGAGSGSATATTTTAAPPKVSKTREMINALLKNKAIVLEYDGRIGRNTAPESEQAAISKARVSHAAGTQRLNAGDYDGAISNYRQALRYYPGYVGSYRGMGLAYERKGDKDFALKALRLYVSVVPHATDVPKLRKLIDTLSKR